MGDNAQPHPDLPSWRVLATFVRNGLPPAAAPSLPPGTPIHLIPTIQSAYQAGALTTSTGTSQLFTIPDIPDTTSPAGALWSYFSQGFAYGLQQRTTLAQNNPRNQAPKIHEPENFNGTRANFTRFMTRLSLVFSSDPSRYQQDAAKIAYAASYLTGSAADWFEPHLNKDNGSTDFATYAAFVTALKNAYDDPDARSTAERKLLNLKQGDRDCSAYHAEFATYVTILNYDDQTKISFFTNGVNQGLLTALSYQAAPPENFDEFVKLCIKLDNRARLLRTKKPTTATATPKPSSHTHASTASGTASGPMDLSLADRTSKKRAPLTDAQKKYRIDNNLCLYCGAEGHFASQCPHSKKKKLNAADTSASTASGASSNPGAPATSTPLLELAKN